MTILDDYTRVRWVRLMAKKDQTGDVLRTFIADVAKPAKVEIGAVYTDEGGEFKGDFQAVLMQNTIRHGLSLPDTLQYNGVT